MANYWLRDGSVYTEAKSFMIVYRTKLSTPKTTHNLKKTLTLLLIDVESVLQLQKRVKISHQHAQYLHKQAKYKDIYTNI